MQEPTARRPARRMTPAYTIEEAARYWGIGEVAILEAIDDGLLPAVRCGPVVRIIVIHLQLLIGDRRGHLPPPAPRGELPS